MSTSPLIRSRWAAIGAAIAVSFGAGGLLTASAAGGGGDSSFVPVTPCRLLDTRAGSTVGPRSTPLGANETLTSAGRGAVGDCTIATDATALSMNVTIVNGTSGSFLTVYPADKDRPTASSLNWGPQQGATPNAVTSPLSGDGRLSFFNLAGTVDLIVDVVGYYRPANPAPWDVIPSGTTVTGVWSTSVRLEAGDIADFAVALPGRAPVPLTNETVNFAADSYAATTDDDASCTGTPQAPTAPPGKVCLYFDYGAGLPDAIDFDSVGIASITALAGYYNGGLNDTGFYIGWTMTLDDLVVPYISWAYTAP